MMTFKEKVAKHIAEMYPSPPKEPHVVMKEWAIHIPEQTVYTTAPTMEDAEEIAVMEYANLHDGVTEVKETK
jgi:hypothetical protein